MSKSVEILTDGLSGQVTSMDSSERRNENTGSLLLIWWHMVTGIFLFLFTLCTFLFVYRVHPFDVRI